MSAKTLGFLSGFVFTVSIPYLHLKSKEQLRYACAINIREGPIDFEGFGAFRTYMRRITSAALKDNRFIAQLIGLAHPEMKSNGDEAFGQFIALEYWLSPQRAMDFAKIQNDEDGAEAIPVVTYVPVLSVHK